MGLFKKPQPEKVRVKGKPLRCLVCAHDHFISHQAQLNKAASSFFNVDWTDPSATCLTCVNCGFIHWFLILD